MPKKSFFINESEADDYQVKIISKKVNQSYIVRGCAGSGKSILALWKVKQIQEESKGSFYFIVYTLTLKQYMKDGITSTGLKDDRVIHFEKWRRDGFPSADYIIVDEAQDFSQEQIMLFKDKARVATWLYGDSAQQLYGWRTPPPLRMEEIINLTKFQDEKLVFNHRLPKKIARFAEYISKDNVDLELVCKNEGIEMPKILKYSTSDSQLDAIIQIIKNRSFEDVGIFLPTNAEVERVSNYLTQKGLNNEVKYDMNQRTINTLNFNSDNPKIVTYHSAKGLQFEAVFIPNCTSNEEDKRSALYVAITRTYQSLFIMHSGNLSTFFDEIPTNLYETSLSGQTGTRL
ncbi:MAG: ATP-binding domain-containing protein [Candidatus Delongbacteria bacterium]|nr:ATP-binding domain-containing protein [Candidatus Delongbacteria bacterium]